MLCPLLLCCVLPAASPLTDADVRTAIDTMREAVMQRHTPQRHWDPHAMPSGESTNQLTGGYTALACLALVTTGEPWHISPLREAIDTLAQGHGQGTYTVALRALLFAELPEQFEPLLRRDVALLVAAFDHEQAGWGYRCEPGSASRRPSPSVRHMALLALREGTARGVPVPGALTYRVAERLLFEQREDGGWGYSPHDGSTGSMTAAAVASLLLALDLHAAPEHAHQAVRRGMGWLDTHFRSAPPPGGGRSGKFPMYWLYALERTAMATGRRHLAGRDWFRDAAEQACHRLLKNKTATKSAVSKNVRGTSGLRQLCFGLLLLHRGRVPLAACLLVADPDAPPPPLPGTFIRAVKACSERSVGWQIVTIDDPLAAWLEAPMLLVDETIEHIDEALFTARLRPFIAAGGTVVFAGRGGRLQKIARAALGSIFPDTRWRRLPAGRLPRGLLVPKVPRPVRADVCMAQGRLVAWLLTDLASRTPSPTLGLLSALLDAWGTATECLPFLPRLAEGLGQPPPPLDIPLRIDWAGSQIPGVDALATHNDGCSVVVAGVNGAAAWTTALKHARNGRPVLLTSSTGDPMFSTQVLEALPASVRPRRWWPMNTGPPRWRPYSRRCRPNRAADLPLLLQAPGPESAGIVLCPCDVLHALKGRRAWGVHGLTADSARSLLAGLEQLQEDVQRDSTTGQSEVALAAVLHGGGAVDRRPTGGRAPADE